MTSRHSPRSPAPSRRLQRSPLFVGLLLSALALPAWAAETWELAIVRDGPSAQSDEIQRQFTEELLALTRGELAVEIRQLDGDWTTAGMAEALQKAYDDPDVDLVLVTGLATCQMAAVRDVFPKPTFVPMVFDARLMGMPRAGLGSGKKNLSYLADTATFADNLEHFLRVVDFKRLGLLVDRLVVEAVPTIAGAAAALARERGIETVLIPFDDADTDLASKIPDHVDAVMIGGLGRLVDQDVEALAEALIQRGLPSFSLSGDSQVRSGILAGDVTDSDWQRIARTTALSMQAVMLGEAAADQPVEFSFKRRLYINLQTAQRLDVWPSYRVLVESVIVGDDPGAGGLGWDLDLVAKEAVRINQDLMAKRLEIAAGALDVREARSAFFPQISADLTHSLLDSDSVAVASGGAAENSLSGAVTLSQLIWSEPYRGNTEILRQVQLSREAELEQFRLDTLQAVTVAFLNILRAETQTRVQRDNLERTRESLELARNRVELGSTSPADVYRWERELATARQNSIDAYTQRTTARENLNRILHRKLSEPFVMVPPGIEDPKLLVADGRILDVIDNPKSFRLMMDLQVRYGLERSPELAALRAAYAAKQREHLSNRRAYYSPSVALQGQVSHIFQEDRVGLSLEGETDWSLGLSASLPLFSGGARKARLRKSELEMQQLEAQITSLEEKLEQNIRSTMHLTNASFYNIELARQAADAAKKNLRLITESYSQGAVSILELLDAQSAALQSNEAAANAVYDFLIDLMNVQRATGRFEFFLKDEERRAFLSDLERLLAYEGLDHE